jgi:hypothetical protein
MLSFNARTYLLALAAIPSLVLGEPYSSVEWTRLMPIVSNATPSGLQTRASKDVLFAKGGPSLDDIAIKEKTSTRSESFFMGRHTEGHR